MTLEEFAKALERARRVFVAVPCTGTAQSVARSVADDVQYFRVSKSEAKRVICSQDGHVIATVRESALFIG